MMNYEQYLTNLEIRAARRAAKIEEARAEFQLFKRHRAEQDHGLDLVLSDDLSDESSEIVVSMDARRPHRGLGRS